MGCVVATEDESPTNSMKTIQRHICKKCKVQFNSESSVCPSCDEETAAAAYADYRERCQAGQKTEDDEEIYESHDEVSHDEEVYDDGYKGALKDFARAFGFSDVIPPMDSDTLLGHARQLAKYRQGYENIQHERDHRTKERNALQHRCDHMVLACQTWQKQVEGLNAQLKEVRDQLAEWEQNRVGAKHG
jgi:hypothetical protein